MSKQHQLNIPIKILPFVSNEVRIQQGAIGTWSEEMKSTGWLTEIEVPLNFKEWKDIQPESVSEKQIIYDERIWNAGIKNDHLKIQQRLESGKKEYMDKHCPYHNDDAKMIQIEHIWNSIVAAIKIHLEK